MLWYSRCSPRRPFVVAQTPSSPATTTVIRAGTLIDPVSGEAKRNQVIVIQGNRVAAVGAASSTQVPAGAKVIDLSNATVLPGMIESHTHIFLQGEDPALGGYDIQLLKFPLAYRAARATVSARRALEQGFTTIRDMETEGAGYGDVGIKMAVNEGRIPGPRIFTTTRGISTTGGYPLEGYAPEITVPKGVQIIDGPVEARKAAREQMDHGADWIKVYMTHRSWTDKDGHLVSQPTLTVEELKAITDEAHSWGRKVACHAYSGEGLHRALDGGCDSIEHGLLLDDAAIAQMKRQGTWYCPTIAIYYKDWSPENTPEGKRDRARASAHEESVKKAVQAGPEDRLRHRRGRLLLGPAHRAGLPVHGEVRHVAGRGAALSDRAASGDAGHERPDRRDRSRGLRRHHRGARRSAQGHRVHWAG